LSNTHISTVSLPTVTPDSREAAPQPMPWPCRTVAPSFKHQSVPAQQADRSLVAEIAEAFLADTPPLFTQLESAIATGDSVTAGRFAHPLKGSSANMGGEAFVRIAAQMQDAGRGGNLVRSGSFSRPLAPPFKVCLLP
jgi:HPt (histidine-containing phosphotransfer) domain-containing protein